MDTVKDEKNNIVAYASKEPKGTVPTVKDESKILLELSGPEMTSCLVGNF